jgi:dUTP pyrophosphatase
MCVCVSDIMLDGRIAPRSGLAAKNFIDTGAGVIDADYRGEVKVLLFNHAETDFEVKEGDRVAQLVLERVSPFIFLFFCFFFSFFFSLFRVR